MSRRFAALTPSITVALILFTVGLTALLAYRALDASRAQQRLTDNTLREYAGFAAFQLKNATISRITGPLRAVFTDVFQQINPGEPAPPLGARQLAALVDRRRSQCRCLDTISFYYQITFADGRIESSPSAVATPANLRSLRDTVVALVRSREAPLPSTTRGTRVVSIGSPAFVPIFSSLGGRPYLIMHVTTVDDGNAPVVAYGYVAPADHTVGSAVRAVLASQPVLPKSLTRDLAIDSILGVRVTDAAGHAVYATDPAIDTRYAATDSLESRFGALRFEVSINPAAAGYLIIGGLPRSRLPEVLATAFVAVSLLALLLYQFRRQEELGRLRDDFVSGVSHELRTPLAQIRILAELLRLGKVPTEERKDRSLRIIDQEARRLSFLVDSILSFTRSQSGRLHPVSTDVAAEIEEIVAGFEPLAQAHSVRLSTSLEHGLVAEIDRGALRQVLLNLLDNAVRYGPPGQTVRIATSSARNTWTLEVADAGPGVPADERERIFVPYYRMQRDAGGPVGGTGIGLAVVRQLVKQHGGEVRVAEIDGGVGARFVVALPISARSHGGR